MAVSKLATKYMFENFGAVRWNGRGGEKITTIVIHHAATTNFDIMPGVWKDREASAHYGIGPDGTIRAYVDEEKRAWHCGNGNSNSIGIECTNISGDPTWKVSEKTIDSLVKLIQEIQSRRGRLIIIGHKDVPGNATACPGPFLYPRLPEIRNRVNNPVVSKPTVKPIVYQTTPGFYEALKDDTFYTDVNLTIPSAWKIEKGQRFFLEDIQKVGKYTRAKVRLNNDVRYCTLRDDYWKFIYPTKAKKVK